MRESVDVLVVYYSETGNTWRVAEALGDSLREKVEVDVIDLLEASEDMLRASRLVVIGTPVHNLRPARPVMEFVRRLSPEILRGKKVALFCTYSLFGAGKALRILRSLLESKGAVVVGELSVVGACYHFRPFVLRRGRPNEDDLRRVREFARRLLSIV